MSDEPIGVSEIYRGPVDGQTAAKLRHCLRGWLENAKVDADRVCDIVLAANEALANSAEHAYRDAGQFGVMLLDLDYDPATATVRVMIADHGRWGVSLSPANRGRGLALMDALADVCEVDKTPDGTTVLLQFDGPAAT